MGTEDKWGIDSASVDTLRDDIKRAERMYDISVRDYFSTFATYSTAATILVAALSFSGDVLTPLYTLTIALIGAYLCVQWHISTVIMRDQYRYFIHRIEVLEVALPGSSKTFTHWQCAQDGARLNDATVIQSVWSHRRLGGLLGMRAAAFPALYGAIFFLIAISQASRIKPENATPVDFVCMVLVLALGFFLLVLSRRERLLDE